MARRKAEIQLQQEIETQEEWEDMLSKEGLFVIDVYQEWCGPCLGMLGNFKKVKNELGDNKLKFAVAKADTIDALEKYRGRCEPCFLFFAGGVLVAVIRGANSPKVLRTITEQLAQEHKVLDGQSERKEIKDTFIAQLESQQKLDEEEDEKEEDAPERPKSKMARAKNRMKFKGEIINFDDSLEPAEGKKEVTVAVIKPDAVKAGKVDEIIADIEAKGIEILKSEERSLTEDEVKEIYAHLQEEPFFNDLVTFMTSGPSQVLVLTKSNNGENIISEFRDLIGPTSVEEAKEKNPESLRAKHGEKEYMNALHGSSSDDMAMRELAFFFPDFVIPSAEAKPKVQRTLALIRPDAFKLHKDEIIQSIQDSGFKVAMQKEMTLTREMAEDFYKEHKDQEYFEELINRMTCGPLLALGLAREDAITGWRQMLGPKEVDAAKEQEPDSLRAKFAVAEVPINQIHGSDTEDNAKKELEYFFPMEQTIAVIKPDAYGTKDEIIERIHESGFRIAARKETTLTREVAEEFYADHKDKEYFEDLCEHMTSGPTYFMVLSREDAVEGWRSLIGPTDPEKAKEENPESLRAAYGKSLLQNAIHGSSTKEQAQSSITKIFGDLKFNEDGTVQEEDELKQEEADDKKSDDEGDEEKKGDVPQSEVPEQEQEEKAVKEEGGVDAADVAPEAKHQEEEQQQQQQEQQQQEEQTTEKTEETPQETTEQKQDTDETPKVTVEQSEEQQQEQTEESKPEEEKKEEEAKPEEEKTEEKKEEEAKTEDEPPKPTEEQKEDDPPKPTEEQKQEEPPKPTEEQKEEPAQEQKSEEPEQQQQQQEQEQTQEEKPADEPAKEEQTEQKAEEPATEQKEAEGEQKTEETEQKTEEAKPEGDKEEKPAEG